MSEQTQPQQLLLLLHVFDSFWFDFPIFSSKPPPSPPSLPPPPESTTPAVNLQLPRSMSEFATGPADYVLSSKPMLETVLSGKEGGLSVVETGEEIGRPGRRESLTRRWRKEKRVGIAKTSSRSLSELEFDELKGFMDLGFVFSERDRDSADLVSIIPGLQRRIGMEDEVRTAEGVSRPYLSEAWGSFEQQRKALPASWRLPEIGNEDGRAMKDQLKFWAQAVASAVR